MWSDEVVDGDAPLRQGDLLFDVPLPDTRLPLQTQQFANKDASIVGCTAAPALVLSQCCDNVRDDYVVVARVKLRGGLRGHLLEALRAAEPESVDGLAQYDLKHFWLRPLDGVLPANPAPDKEWLAELLRTTTFHGDCSGLRSKRVARMTVVGRRLLRIKLGLRWSRPAQEDLAELAELGLPLGPRPL